MSDSLMTANSDGALCDDCSNKEEEGDWWCYDCCKALCPECVLHRHRSHSLERLSVHDEVESTKISDKVDCFREQVALFATEASHEISTSDGVCVFKDHKTLVAAPDKEQEVKKKENEPKMDESKKKEKGKDEKIHDGGKDAIPTTSTRKSKQRQYSKICNQRNNDELTELSNMFGLEKEIERERADLPVQLITMTDRLEDAIDAQLHVNRKREVELQKLRKWLEESQIENEEAINSVKKKHQETVLDYQGQIEILNKKNSKIDRENHRLEHDVAELTSSIDQLQKDKHQAEKLADKLEEQNRDLNGKVEEQQKMMVKVLDDFKVQLENMHHVKHQIAQQIEEAHRRFEDAKRVSP